MYEPVPTPHSARRRGARRRLPAIWMALVMIMAMSAGTLRLLPAAAQDTPTANDSLSVADVAERANPAVVTVYTFISGQPNTGLLPNAPGAPGGQSGPDQQPLGAGSGWIYDNGGHVVTNAHVVRGADAFTVQFQDGTKVDASLVGVDQFQDVAVLQLDLADGQALPGVATVGDSAAMRAGDQVVALGTPLGEFANSVSEGIIGGLDRSLDTGAGYRLGHLIQHDAPLSSGNSGGPLLNMRGEVIGMNVAAIDGRNQLGSSPSISSGLGFAIDGNTVVKSVKEILANAGDVVYPYLGIEIQPTATGQVVASVAPGSPADQAGLRRGDLIVAVDGTPLSVDDPLMNLLFAHRPGDTVSLKIQRNGETQELAVTLGERPRDL